MHINKSSLQRHQQRVTEVVHVAALEEEIHNRTDQSMTRERIRQREKDNNPLHGNLAKALLTCQVL